MAKSGIQGLAAGRSDLFRIDPRVLTIKDGWNARDFSDPENQRHVETLAASIREVGVQEPLTVVMEDGHPVVTNGESRLRAVRMLLDEGVDIKTVPVQTEARHASDADKLASQIVRNSGKPFTVIETSHVFARLIGYGWTEKDVAARAGLTVERVRQILTLNAAPASVRKKVRSGAISATVVQRIAAKADGDSKKIADQVDAAIQKAKEDGKTKASPRHVRAANGHDAPRKPRVSHRDLLAELLSYAGAEEGYEDGDVTVRLTVPNARWKEIQAAVK